VPSAVLSNFDSLPLFAPELGLILGILLLIGWDLAKSGPGKESGLVAIALVTLTYAGAQSAMYLVRDEPSRLLFGGLMASDRFAHSFRALFAAVTAVIVIFSAPGHEKLKGPDAQKGIGEFYVLLLTIALGLNMMAMSRNLLMIYLSLELVSVISFIMAGYKMDDRKSSEAGLKYVIFGGVASGIMLYGMSWLFGLTQSLNLAEISRRVVTLSAEQHRVPEAVFIAKDGRTITDRAEIAAQFQRDMSLGLPLKANVRHVFVGDDTAQIVVDWSIDGKDPEGQDVHLGGSASDIVRRGADGRWRYIIDNNQGTAVRQRA
jgi:NADH-quinone oxidoreductase subunit N